LNGTSRTVGVAAVGAADRVEDEAQSSTVRHIGPILSMLHDSAMAPWRLTRPNVGRRPVTPLRVAGDTMEPCVSVPMAKPTRPAAVAAPGPGRRAARALLRIPRVARHAAEPAVALRECAQRQLRDEHRAGGVEALDDGGVVSSTWSRYGDAPHVVG
jgi:hypothetical protein